MNISLHNYRLTSKKRGGQYSGPCWYTGEGRDRFTIEPNPPEGGPPRWFCRACSFSCGHGFSGGATRYGTFHDKQAPERPKMKARKNVVTLQMVETYERFLDDNGLEYLKSRGISETTARHFRLGMVGGVYITIPCVYTWKDKVRCQAIKKRWIEKHRPADQPAYLALPGSKTKAIFNFNILQQDREWGIIANSLFDVMLLHELGLPVVGPFAGEASWDDEWFKYIHWETVVNLGDWDDEIEPIQDGGEPYRPGTLFMLARAVKLRGNIIQNVINVYPPNGATDVSRAWEKGEDIKAWINSLIGG